MTAAVATNRFVDFLCLSHLLHAPDGRFLSVFMKLWFVDCHPDEALHSTKINGFVANQNHVQTKGSLLLAQQLVCLKQALNLQHHHLLTQTAPRSISWFIKCKYL
jgi:hypothetical protein